MYEGDIMQKQSAQRAGETAALKRQREAVDSQWNVLCQKLDVLLAFGGGHKGRQTDELELRADAPTLRMEELIPLAIGSAQQLAPAEIYEKRGTGAVRTRKELTIQERNALRRAANRKRQQRKPQRTDKKTPSSSNVERENAVRQLARNKVRYYSATEIYILV